MYRLVFLFCAVVVACGAAQITESVSCAGYYNTLGGLHPAEEAETQVFNLPPQLPGSNLECMFPVDSATAIAGDLGDILGFQVVAVPFVPPNAPCDGCDLPPTDVAASYSIVGDFVLQESPVPAFWSVCITADDENYEGTGTASASGFFGPGMIGSPCDFAHAVPFPSSGTVTFPVNLSASAAGNAVFEVNVRPEFFDAGGNALGGGFTLVGLPTVPEPATIIPAALALIVLGLMRWGVGDSNNT